MHKNQNIEKIIFKVVQMKFLAMHITNQKLSFDIFMVGHLLNVCIVGCYDCFCAPGTHMYIHLISSPSQRMYVCGNYLSPYR